MKKLVGFAAILSTISASWAGDPIDEKIEAEQGVSVLIENVHGLVKITGWDRPELHVTGELADDAERVVVSEEYGRVLVRVLMPRSGSSSETELIVSAPASSPLVVETVSADIEVTGMNESQRLNTVGGDVITHSTGKTLEVKSATGDIRVTGDGMTRESRVTSVSGDVTVSGVTGEVDAKSVSGDVSIEGNRINRVRLTSTSGDLRLTGGVENDPRLVLESISGDAILEIDGELVGEFDVRTMSGEITSCFGPGAEDHEFGAGQRLQFTDEEGRAEVRIKTMSGDVKLLCRG